MRKGYVKISLSLITIFSLSIAVLSCGKKGGETSTLTPSPGLTIEVKREKELPSLPTDWRAVSPMYSFNVGEGESGPVRVTLPLDAEVESGRNLDAYTWEEEKWRWFTSASLTVDGTSVDVDCPNLPSNLAILQAGPKPPQVSGWLVQGEPMDAPAQEALTVLNPLCYQPKADGTVSGTLAQLPQGKYEVFPTIQNKVGQEFRGDIVDTILSSRELREKHAAIIANLARDNNYSGIDIDYRAVDPALRDQFTQFVFDLASRLHSDGRLLTLSVAQPQKESPGWNCGAYDLHELGRAADAIKIPGEKNQDLYAVNMKEVLEYATSQIDRGKIQLMVSRSSHDRGEAGIIPISQAEALQTAAHLGIDGPSTIELGQATTLFALNLIEDGRESGLFWSDDARAVTLIYNGEDGQHVLWIENIFSVAFKLELVNQLGLGGIAIENVASEPGEAQIWPVVQTFKDEGKVQTVRPNESLFIPQWKSTGGVLVVESFSRAKWTAPQVPGDYQVTLTVSDGIARAESSIQLAAVSAPTPTPTPTPAPTSTPTPPPTATPSVSPSATPTTTPTSVSPSPTPTATPTPVSGGTPTPSPTPLPTSTPTVAPTATPTPTPSGGVNYPGVGYGMCVNPNNDLNRALILLKQAGFNWAKIQLRWEHLQPAPGDENIQWGSIDSIVNTCQAQGVRILFSIVTAPDWARPADTDFSVAGPPANLQDFADFVGKVANRYKGRVQAIEVWNEQNLWYEWGGRGNKINAAQYVDLLSRTYQAIKAADPNIVVMSGALTPTGFTDHDTAVDDVLYMREMYQAGLKNWCDVVGAHANVASDNAPDEWISTDDTTTRKWHGSFFFLRFRELYQVMQEYGDGGKQIWFTEFGWASIEHVAETPVPGYEYAAQVSEQEHATYLTRAFELVKQSYPYIGVMFVWNLNYNGAPGDEKSAWSVLYQDWNPRPAYHALTAMPK